MTTNSGKATSMAELMAKHKSSFISLKRGETVTGILSKLTPSESLMDLNGKTEALVLEKEKKLARAMMAMLKVGEKVEATVLSSESDSGMPIVSVRKYLDKKIWERLFEIQKKQEKLHVHVKMNTKGGYLVETEYGLDGFLPNSHVSFDKHAEDYTGKTLEVMIAELNPETRKLIVSQKPVLSQANFDEIAKTLKTGSKVEAMVSHITQFGVFVSLPVKTTKGEETFVDGLIHISEVAWEKVTELTGLFNVGDTVEAIVTGIDTNAKRIDLSIKRLTADPFEELLKKYSLDQKVTGKVEKISEQGVTIALEDEEIEGFIRKEKIPPTTKYTEGEKVTATVTDVDVKKHRVYLTPVLLAKPLMYR